MKDELFQQLAASGKAEDLTNFPDMPPALGDERE
jgi:hypothetical protein